MSGNQTPHMPDLAFDPDAAAIVAMIAASGLPAYENMTTEQARATMAQFGPAMAFAKVDVGSVEDINIAGSQGSQLTLRIYRPASPIDRPGPALINLHGGGWMLGNLESHDDICRKFCVELDAVVVAVDYRLAPEHPFPAAVEDAFTAVRWVFANHERLGCDADRIAVGGDSAGGNLAAVVALASAAGELPRIAAQMLLYPVTDLYAEGKSYARVTDGVPLTAATMRWFKAAYLVSPEDAGDWRASPALAKAVAGVAPAFVMTMYHDPLCDEGIAYAEKLASAGNLVTHIHYTQHIHGLLSMGAMIRDAEAAVSIAAAWLKARFRPALTSAV